jgi:hypothetical protein
MEPTFYTNAPVEDMANDLIQKYDELSDCSSAIIKYVFKNAEKSKHAGVCSKATGKWKFLVDVDYVIELHFETWDELDELQQKALLFHELHHIEKQTKVKDGEEIVTWKIREHTNQLFLKEVELFGAWNSSLVQLQNAFLGIKTQADLE